MKMTLAADKIRPESSSRPNILESIPVSTQYSGKNRVPPYPSGPKSGRYKTPWIKSRALVIHAPSACDM